MIKFSSLPKNIQQQIRANYGDDLFPTPISASPYEDTLGRALEERFPGRAQPQYRPLARRRFLRYTLNDVRDRLEFVLNQIQCALDANIGTRDTLDGRINASSTYGFQR